MSSREIQNTDHDLCFHQEMKLAMVVIEILNYGTTAEFNLFSLINCKL